MTSECLGGGTIDGIQCDCIDHTTERKLKQKIQYQKRKKCGVENLEQELTALRDRLSEKKNSAKRSTKRCKNNTSSLAVIPAPAPIPTVETMIAAPVLTPEDLRVMRLKQFIHRIELLAKEYEDHILPKIEQKLKAYQLALVGGPSGQQVLLANRLMFDVCDINEDVRDTLVGALPLDMDPTGVWSWMDWVTYISKASDTEVVWHGSGNNITVRWVEDEAVKTDIGERAEVVRKDEYSIDLPDGWFHKIPYHMAWLLKRNMKFFHVMLTVYDRPGLYDAMEVKYNFCREDGSWCREVAEEKLGVALAKEASEAIVARADFKHHEAVHNESKRDERFQRWMMLCEEDKQEEGTIECLINKHVEEQKRSRNAFKTERRRLMGILKTAAANGEDHEDILSEITDLLECRSNEKNKTKFENSIAVRAMGDKILTRKDEMKRLEKLLCIKREK